LEELLRTNDPVLLSYACHLLDEAGIEYWVFDFHVSAVEGSIGAFPRRLMVEKINVSKARMALHNVSLTIPDT